MASVTKVGIAVLALSMLAWPVGESFAGVTCTPCTVSIADLTDTPTATLTEGSATFPLTPLSPSAGELLHVQVDNTGTPTSSTPMYVDFFEDAAHTLLSDRLLVSFATAGLIDTFFASDPAILDLPPGAVNEGNFTENGQFQTALTVSGSEGLTFIFQVQSDAGDRQDVPEPATLRLLGSGLGGLAGIAWRRHRSAWRRHPR